MVKAKINWCFDEFFIYEFENEKALVFSSPSYEGDGSYRYFESIKRAYSAIGYTHVVRDKGETLFSDDFIEEVRVAPSGRFFPPKDSPYYREKGYHGQEQHQAEMIAAIELRL